MAEETSDIESRALKMGWFPKEQWKGDPDRWTDAATYVERGEQLLPILRANNQRLMDEVQALRTKTAEQDQVIKSATESIEELKKFNTEAARDKVKDQKDAVKAALVEAKKAGNVEQEVELTEQLNDLNAALKTPAATEKKTEPAKETTAQPNVEAQRIFQEWVADNPWYTKDLRKAAVANAVAQELRAADPQMSLKGRAFYDKVSEEVEKTFGGNPQRQGPAKVDGGTRGNNGAEKGGRSYADLPADAKAACDRQAQRLVGPKGSGRAFETIEAWQKHYAQKYDWEG